MGLYTEKVSKEKWAIYRFKDSLLHTMKAICNKTMWQSIKTKTIRKFYQPKPRTVSTGWCTEWILSDWCTIFSVIYYYVMLRHHQSKVVHKYKIALCCSMWMKIILIFFSVAKALIFLINTKFGETGMWKETASFCCFEVLHLMKMKRDLVWRSLFSMHNSRKMSSVLGHTNRNGDVK